MPTDGADYVAAAKDIVAYWESLESAENPNGLWYLQQGDIHNLMDIACEEIIKLRKLLHHGL